MMSVICQIKNLQPVSNDRIKNTFMLRATEGERERECVCVCVYVWRRDR